ncbi:phage tail length tape measure family protein [Mesorhizobium amorphae]|uniref:phage tail length tape measure family protein n=1 Tax=Mesorhizobium amorphae TaxID=71433 RepID=UPI00118223D9|nr:phage tail length tape measure family protein [Mesorhizobium amorphae]
MAIEAERLLAIFEARFTSLEKALEKARTNANKAFGDIEASGTKAEDALSRVGEKGLPGIDRAAKSVATMKGNTANLAAQLNDIGVQLAGGQSPFLIAIQQGTQINQALGPAGARGAVTALGGAFMSLLNPVGLATLAIIAGGGYAAQYFLEIISGGEKSAETLKNEAELIQRVVNKWGDALPALQAYAKEREALADKKDLEEATNIGKENAFEKTREQVDALRADLALLIGDLAHSPVRKRRSLDCKMPLRSCSKGSNPKLRRRKTQSVCRLCLPMCLAEPACQLLVPSQMSSVGWRKKSRRRAQKRLNSKVSRMAEFVLPPRADPQGISRGRSTFPKPHRHPIALRTVRMCSLSRTVHANVPRVVELVANA